MVVMILVFLTTALGVAVGWWFAPLPQTGTYMTLEAIGGFTLAVLVALAIRRSRGDKSP